MLLNFEGDEFINSPTLCTVLVDTKLRNIFYFIF